MLAPTVRWTLIVLLVVAGIYMVAFHTDPLPANHEAVGLGTVHIAHDAVGVVLFVVALYLWLSARPRPGAASAK